MNKNTPIDPRRLVSRAAARLRLDTLPGGEKTTVARPILRMPRTSMQRNKSHAESDHTAHASLPYCIAVTLAWRLETLPDLSELLRELQPSS